MKDVIWTTVYNRSINNASHDDIQRIGDSYWYYSEVRTATVSDEDRVCPWCSVAPAGGLRYSMGGSSLYTAHSGDTRNFKKGDIVIREQFSHTNFTTYHPACSLLKMREIQIEFESGIQKIEDIVKDTHNGELS
jgi:hypothetical protein|tara:strand:- start:1361 stop:1762 length:402 start_codon:yes stop_codon:yes gene_type:complete